MRSPYPIVGVLLTACFHSVPPEPATPRTATAVNASFGKSWDATIDVFAEKGISIETLDRASGLIVPAGRVYVPADLATIDGLADCGKAGSGLAYSPTDVKYNVVVRGDSTQSTVQVRAFYRAERAPYECVSRGLFERATETDIKDRAEGRAGGRGSSNGPSDEGCTDSARREGNDYRVTLHQTAESRCTPIKCTIRGAANKGTP